MLPGNHWSPISPGRFKKRRTLSQMFQLLYILYTSFLTAVFSAPPIRQCPSANFGSDAFSWSKQHLAYWNTLKRKEQVSKSWGLKNYCNTHRFDENSLFICVNIHCAPSDSILQPQPTSTARIRRCTRIKGAAKMTNEKIWANQRMGERSIHSLMKLMGLFLDKPWVNLNCR